MLSIIYVPQKKLLIIAPLKDIERALIRELIYLAYQFLHKR